MDISSPPIVGDSHSDLCAGLFEQFENLADTGTRSRLLANEGANISPADYSRESNQARAMGKKAIRRINMKINKKGVTRWQ